MPMSLFVMACRNLARRPVRSLLTTVGVAVGVAAALSLMHLAWGFERAVAGGYQARGTDLIVGRVTSQRPMTTPFPAGMARELERLPDVQATAGILGDLLTIEDRTAVVVLGWESGTFLWEHLQLLTGRWPERNERCVVLGSIAAEMLDKRLGDRLRIDTADFRVAGIYASPAIIESGAVLMPLAQLQALGGREGLVSLIGLRLRPDADQQSAERIRQTVKAKFPGFSAATGSEAVQRNVAVQASKAVSVAVSLVALALSAVGVVNTMLMSVLERIREIALLLAVGWRRARVIRLILIEAVVLTVAGGVLGTGLGAAILWTLSWTDWFRGKTDTSLDVPTVALVLAATVVVGVVSGCYPAWMGARMEPSDGLRHE
jgi:putative ABC transport system permease protein